MICYFGNVGINAPLYPTFFGLIAPPRTGGVGSAWEGFEVVLFNNLSWSLAAM